MHNGESFHFLQLFLKGGELFDKTAIGFSAGPFVSDCLQAFVEGEFVLLHHVGYQDCCWSWNAWWAVYQDIALFPASFDEIVGGGEGEGYVLVVGVFHVEDAVWELLGVFEFDICSCADGGDLVLLQLLEVFCEMFPADPDLAEIPLAIYNFLSVVFVDAWHLSNNLCNIDLIDWGYKPFQQLYYCRTTVTCSHTFFPSLSAILDGLYPFLGLFNYKF